MTQRVNKRRKTDVAEKPSVKRRNAPARQLAWQTVANKTYRCVIDHGHDRCHPPAEGAVTKESVVAGRLPVTTRTAAIG